CAGNPHYAMDYW
nr:immunoglobulin heavy chain junction region [Mus musculus]MBK4195867.1 immunoglobulin heavy chain junction region [Mus musculus]